MNVEDLVNEGAKFTITHIFDSPKKLVFNAFSNEDALAEWWGPVECKNTVLKLDFRTGGIFHYKMEKDGVINYGRFTFGRIEPYDLLEFTNAFSDEHANIIRAPFDIQLPVQIFYQFRFAEKKGKTIITMTGLPVKATREEEEAFRSINTSMEQGFGATFKQLSLYLEKIQARP